MYKKTVIIDGYVDEPASFGVPPYIGTYPRYIAGILKSFGMEYDYFTIDSLRSDIALWKNLKQYGLIIVVAGMTVPGKYVGGVPITLNEVQKIGESFDGFKIIGGPIKLGYSAEGRSKAVPLDLVDYNIFCHGDIEAVLYNYLKTGQIDTSLKRDEKFLKEFAVLGAEIVTKHPNYPYVIAEIETSRGCERDVFCSYCTESFYGKVDFRDEEDIISEVEALYGFGERYFRIGRQSNIIAYKGKDRPNPAAIKKLYEGIRRVAPELKVLHTDNANPGYIAKFPEESFEIIKTIAEHNTAGDILAFGVESFDKNVIEKNFLKSNPEDVKIAVEIVNRAGGFSINGIPKVLPGINLVYGLIGETNETYEINFRYLKEILDAGLLVRRINIRQVMVFEGTRIAEHYKNNKIKVNDKLFKKYKDKVREEIDFEMLKRVFPSGSALLTEVLPEFTDHNITFGRQLGTYPILTGIPGLYELGKPIDVMVTSHGFRSITGLCYPLHVNTASLKEFEEIPGIGKKSAKTIIELRPFESQDDLKKKASPEIYENLIKYSPVF